MAIHVYFWADDCFQEIGAMTSTVIDLIFRDLHIMHNVVCQLIHGLFDRAAKFGGVYESVNELKDTEHQVFKSQHFTWGERKGVRQT